MPKVKVQLKVSTCRTTSRVWKEKVEKIKKGAERETATRSSSAGG